MEKLLDAVQAIREKYDAIYKSTGSSFNIFRIVNIDTDEVRICRVIKELIDPCGSHYQGDVYLRLFVKHVLSMEREFLDTDYSAAAVRRELVIDNDRRIDLFIEIGSKRIPIEVKIYAGDQNGQCRDYDRYAVNSRMFYLTLDGHTPSKESMGGLGADRVQAISFQKHIINWLHACLELPQTAKIAPVREIIAQLIEVLKMLTGQGEEGMKMDIQHLILSSKANMKAADMICKAMEQVKKEIKTRLFKALDEQIRDRYHWDRLINSWDYASDGHDAKPGISYLLQKIDGTNFELWLRIEIDSRDLFAGLCIAEDGTSTAASIHASKELGEAITENVRSSQDWWITWAVIPDQNHEQPNFSVHNESYYALADDVYFSRFVASAMSCIEKVLNGLRMPYSNAVIDQTTT